jgi:outer membrane protein assembly factor BamA
VIIAGELRTREGIIESALHFRPGDVLDPDKLAESQRNLQTLGIFTRVTVEPLVPTHVDAEKDVVVSVDERPTYEITAGPGFSLVDGPRAAGEFVWSNVSGLGVDFVVQGKLNYFNWSYPVLFAPSGPDQLQPQPGLAGFGGHVNVGLRDPRLYFAQPYQVAAHADVVAERVNRPAYRFSRFAVLGGLDWRVAGPLTFGFSLSPFEVDDIRKQQGLETIITRLSQTDLQQLRFEDGITRLATLTPALTLDLRDNASSPHSGFLLAATTEVAHDLGGNFSTFYAKPTVTANVYVPLTARVTLALSARGGRVYPLESNSYTVPPKRFFLGGANTLRGYPEDGLTPDDRRTVLDKEVQNCQALSNPVGCSEAAKVAEQGALLPSEGGQAFVLYKGELRFPVVGDLEGGLFVDAGNLWLDTRFANLRPGNLVYTPGAGIRYGTPVGPIALDVGINPNPDTLLNETVLSLRYVQFSIGLF